MTARTRSPRPHELRTRCAPALPHNHTCGHVLSNPEPAWYHRRTRVLTPPPFASLPSPTRSPFSRRVPGEHGGRRRTLRLHGQRGHLGHRDAHDRGAVLRGRRRERRRCRAFAKTTGGAASDAHETFVQSIAAVQQRVIFTIDVRDGFIQAPLLALRPLVSAARSVFRRGGTWCFTGR